MRAIIRKRFGGPSVLEFAELPLPVPNDDQLLVRVAATSLNRADWYAMVGRPLVGRPSMGWRRPKSERLGTDYSGVVEEVGKNVSGFQVDDEVFGGRDGALAEYITPRHDRAVVRKPAGITHEQAAAIPVAAITALQALRDHGGVQPGERVLINGASGGVGSFAVQIAKAFGADVTAVCGPRGLEAARAGGADRVVDYSSEDSTRLDMKFDLVIDIAGNRSWRQLRRVLTPRARVIVVGGRMGGVIGPLGHVLRIKLRGMFSRRQAKFFIAKFNKPDMETLRDMLADGRVRPVIDRTFRFDEFEGAFRYLGEGHPQGKVVLSLGQPGA
ncbi:MAG: NAD(P)-dependent alcohol dehydrogenase [Acidimicrobiia bacterium]